MTRGSWRTLATAAVALLVLGAARPLAAQGTVAGRVTAQGTDAPLADARIILIGTTISASTGADGKFTLRNVPAGTAQLQVLRVGFQSQKKSVAVTTGASATVDFVLPVAVAQLEEVVTTATGQQRRVELGNAVSTLGDVGKNVEQRQISSVSDMLTAKAPGVVVLPGSTLGGEPTVRVRGVSSISLSNAPIWYVDGVRYSAGATNSGTDTNFSLLNSLNPEEIEDIEIVKGPSAATLYGTDAANGVVVITTKKGRAGATRWNWSAEAGNVDDRTNYQDMYANWGHVPGDPSNQIRCQLAIMSATTCISDSVTHYNLLDDPSKTFVHMGHRNMGALQVSGGSDAVRFFTSGSFENETGPIQMPGYEVDRFNSQHTAVRDEWFHPLAQQKMGFRANVNATVSPKFDVSANAGFARSDNRIEPESDLFISLYYVGMQNYGFKGPGLDKETTDVDGTPLNDYLQYAPGDIMQFYSNQDVQRFTGSFNTSWRPFAWMQNDGTVGIDQANINFFSLCRLNECPPQSPDARSGFVQDNNRNDRSVSAKITSTSSWNARTWANLKTTLGVDYTNIELDSVNTSGIGLPPGATTVFASTSPTRRRTTAHGDQDAWPLRAGAGRASRSALPHARGAHRSEQRVRHELPARRIPEGEHVVDHLRRVLLPADVVAQSVPPAQLVRCERRSTGTHVRPDPVPSGTVAIAHRGETAADDTPALTASNPGNADLKPERSTELEAGFETQMLNNRLHFDYTFYNKKTRDALIIVPIAGSAGASTTSLLQNVGCDAQLRPRGPAQRAARSTAGRSAGT